MTIFYSVCAVLGCTVLACQFLLTVTGLSGVDDLESGHDFDGSDVGHDIGHEGGHDGTDPHHDHAHSHGTNWFFGVISFRTVTAALAFFGLTGLALSSSGVGQGPAMVGAAAAGVASMYFVHWMMRSMALLRAEGTVRVADAVGVAGTVYIRIPGHNGGSGKVQITLQGRTVELSATTEGDLLPTGARIVVTKVVGSDAVQVVPEAAQNVAEASVR